MEIVYIVITAMLGVTGWALNRLVNTMDEIQKSMKGIQKDINDIKITVQAVSTSHDNVKERVEKIEQKVFS